MRLILDQRQGFRVTYDRNRGAEIRRPGLALDMTLVDGVTGTDPEALFQIEEHADFPGYGAPFPTTRPRYALATLDGIEITSPPNGKADQATFDLIYRTPAGSGDGGGGGSVWTVTEGGQGGYVETYGTAGGLQPLVTWYHKGTGGAVTSPPVGTKAIPTAYKHTRGVHRFYPSRSLRVTGVLLRADWDAIKASIRAAAGTINSSQWGGSATDSRGTWLFMFPTTRTVDLGRSYYVDLQFVHDRKGHYPIGIHIDERGNHPADCASEADLRAGGIPTEGFVRWRNGISIFSVYDETDFNALFAFTPN